MQKACLLSFIPGLTAFSANNRSLPIKGYQDCCNEQDMHSHRILQKSVWVASGVPQMTCLPLTYRDLR